MKNLKKLFCLLLALVFILPAAVSCAEDGNDEDSSAVTTASTHNAPAMESLNFTSIKNIDAVTISDTPTDYVMISVKDYGKIIVRLFPDVAPRTVENFKTLVSQNFYDGLIFHRVIDNFMIQGGDPEGTGMGGSANNVYGEFTKNGFQNNLSHKRGVISMARNGYDMNSASSQFFIVHQDSVYLDGQYSSFGYTVYGMDVVDEIANIRTDANDRPKATVVMESVRFVNVPTEAYEEKIEEPPVIEELPAAPYSRSETETDLVLLNVKGYGQIVISLEPETAPITVANFKKLVSEKFYDGLIFHRVIADFMIQGGDPEGTGFGGSDETIKGEFSANGVENNISHVRGVISMARNSLSMDSASSQFFIVHKDSTFLDGDYAAFGCVVWGIETVDRIAEVKTNSNDKPLSEVVITEAYFVEAAETDAGDAEDENKQS